MKKETRVIVYDDELKIEAYHLKGIVQAFPNHFHEYYVIGLIEAGERYLSCKNKEYTLKQGDIVLFNPNDNHACAQIDGAALDYRGINIAKEIMLDLVEEITAKRSLLKFSQNVINNADIAYHIHLVHEMIMNGSNEFSKEENLLLLISALVQEYGEDFEKNPTEYREEIEKVCKYIETNYTKRISLEEMCQLVCLSKSTLLRAFTKTKAVTPYRYLEAIRINEAKKLLEQGFMPIEVAMQTGFSDQSHFTNYFTRFIGLTPAVYREIFYNKIK